MGSRIPTDHSCIRRGSQTETLDWNIQHWIIPIISHYYRDHAFFFSFHEFTNCKFFKFFLRAADGIWCPYSPLLLYRVLNVKQFWTTLLVNEELLNPLLLEKRLDALDVKRHGQPTLAQEHDVERSVSLRDEQTRDEGGESGGVELTKLSDIWGGNKKKPATVYWVET